MLVLGTELGARAFILPRKQILDGGKPLSERTVELFDILYDQDGEHELQHALMLSNEMQNAQQQSPAVQLALQNGLDYE